MLYVAKAITAFVVVLVSLLLGDEVSKSIDVDTLQAAILALLAAIGVYAVPNAGTVNHP